MSAQKVRTQPSLALIIAAATLALIVIAALAAPLLPIPDPDLPDLHARSAPPFWLDGAVPGHLLGTDSVGRDLLSRLIHGARTSLAIGIGVTLVAAVIGIGLGLVAGYFGGVVDTCVSFLITARLAMPVVLICLASVAVFGASFTVITAVLGAMLWDRFALVARSMTKSVRAADFVTAARLQGASTIRVLLTEVVPTIGNQLIVIATLEVGLAIVLESALSFLGMGVPPPTASWGLMIAEGKEELLFAPWLVIIPGTALFVLIMAINVLGDGLQRDRTGERG